MGASLSTRDDWLWLTPARTLERPRSPSASLTRRDALLRVSELHLAGAAKLVKGVL